jgi:predicted glutamine amidotransferase
MAKLYILIALLISFTFLVAECEFMGMISRAGQSVSWEEDDTGSTYSNPEDPYDYFEFLYHHSHDSNNKDGYGVISYDEKGMLPPILYPDVSGFIPDYDDESIILNNTYGQAWYLISDPEENDGIITKTGNEYDPPFGNAFNHILDNETEISTILGHVRNGTGGNGSHPFCRRGPGRYDECKTYSYMHNGFISYDLKLYCYNYAAEHLTGFASQWSGVAGSLSTWIDSEVFFLYLMAYIEAADYDVLSGLHSALNNATVCDDLMNSSSDNRMNFVFSDGDQLYLFCNYHLNSEYRIYYKDFDNYYGLITETPSNTTGWDQVAEDELVVLSRYGETIFPGFMSTTVDYTFISGDLDLSSIDDDTYISGNSQITGQESLSDILQFAGHYELEITGSLSISSGGNLSLNHGAIVDVHGSDSRLFLGEGAIVEGCVPRLPQSSYSGISSAYGVHGDYIIAQGGGIITTQASDVYNQNDLVVDIRANEDYISWDGIYIKDPWTIDFIASDYDKISLTNCEFDGMDNLQIYDSPFVSQDWEVRTVHFYASNFRNGNQVSIQDGHILNIEGIDLENNPCEFTGNYRYAIASYYSQLNMKNTVIGGSSNNANYHGVYLYDSDNGESSFEDCEVSYNNGTGFIFNSTYVGLFDNISSSYNDLHGIYCHNGTRFIDDPQFNSFTNVELLQNEKAEFIAWESESFRMGNGHPVTLTPYETDYPILVNLFWEDGDGAVDIRGTDLVSDDVQYLLPADPDAWIVNENYNLSDEAILLSNAALEIAGENYDEAEIILKGVIDVYPDSKEAASAVYYLYQLTGMTDKDYPALITYLQSIYFQEGSELAKAVKAVIAKSFMKEELYLQAIATIEDLIASLEDEDEIISALIDEGYYYLQLAESGIRDLPEECTLKVNSFNEYQSKVFELQNQMSNFKAYDYLTNVQKPSQLLSTNYPNPFNPSTTIQYVLPVNSHLELAIYNIKGQKINTLIDEYCQSGTHSIVWDGNDASGSPVASGLYFYRLKTDNETNSGKLMLLK